jgi:hypothetical protein
VRVSATRRLAVRRWTTRRARMRNSLVERGVAPLSAYGQRRRLARLGALAEYIHRWAGARA